MLMESPFSGIPPLLFLGFSPVYSTESTFIENNKAKEPVSLPVETQKANTQRHTYHGALMHPCFLKEQNIVDQGAHLEGRGGVHEIVSEKPFSDYTWIWGSWLKVFSETRAWEGASLCLETSRRWMAAGPLTST